MVAEGASSHILLNPALLFKYYFADPLIKADAAQALMVRLRDAGRVLRQLGHVIKHRSILLRDGRKRVVLFERPDQIFIKSDPTQKLCVRLDSIVAAVDDGHDGRDHLVLPPTEWQIRRREHAECGECVI